MQYRKLGTTDIEASVIGFGAWAIGGMMWGGSEEKDALRAIDAAIDHGINLIDTAPMYGCGRSEEILGKAIPAKRDKVVLATKCGLRWDDKDWPVGEGTLKFYVDQNGVTKDASATRIYQYLRPKSIRYEVEQSLKRLRTDYIDLLQTHWQDATTPIAATMETLLKLKDQGKIRAIGVSNVTADQIREYLKIGPIDVVQERFSMIDRKIDDNGILEECRKNGISVLAYSPMSHGLLTGHITPDRKFNPGDLRNGHPRFTPENIEKINWMLQEFTPIASKYHLASGQLVVAWTASHYEKMHVLCGARNDVQVAENAMPGDVLLTEDEMKIIDDIVREFTR